MKFDKTYRHSIAFDRPIPFNMYTFIGIVKTHFDLPNIITQRVEFIIQNIVTSYQINFRRIPYENVILGATMFAVNEFNNKFKRNSPTFNVSEFVTLMYGKNKFQKNIIQVYYTLYVINDLFAH